MKTKTPTTYRATLGLDAVTGQWTADIDGLPVHTWARTLAKVKRHAHEALALHLDVPVETLAGRIEFSRPELPGVVVQALDAAESARSAADGAAAQATAARAAAARALVRDAHLSMRDAAEILGLSHQRVQQLLAS